MSSEWTIIGIVLLVILAIIGVHLYLAIIACSLIVMVVGLNIDTYGPLSIMFTKLSNYNLLAIPLFIFLGSALATGGAGRSLVKFLNAFMGHIPGGPAYALIFASVVVAAMCAHPMAAIAGFGPVIIPMLVELGYSKVFAVGLLLASASLAPLIPPNTMGIIYTVIANANPDLSEYADIKTLWTGAIIPGVVLALLLCIVVFYYSRRGHFQRLPSVTWAERLESVKEAWPVALTPFAVLGPLYANWANPTEVAAIGVVYILVISRFFYKGMTWKGLWTASVNTLHILAAIFLIIMAALLLTYVFVRAHVPQDITTWISDMGLSWWAFMAILIFVFTFMGMFLDPAAIVLIAVPMLLTTADTLGIDIYVFGIFTIITVTIAGITPPYGLCIFASQSILQMPYHFIVRSCIMFLPALIIGLILVAFVPQLTTWLPDFLGY